MIELRVKSFPTFRISKQLFHVPGAVVDGGFTSGGARMTSPEPGGFAALEIQPAYQIGEWEFPLASWLMSQGNGQIFRVRLAPTPQIASSRSIVASVPWGAEGVYPDAPWSNLQNWDGDLIASYSAVALEGTNVVRINMAEIGPLLRHGHVIGHGFNTYLVDDIEYEGLIAVVTVNPPLRRDVMIDDPVYFRSYFTGSIANPGEFRTTYDADKAGGIQLGKILLTEVILP